MKLNRKHIIIACVVTAAVTWATASSIKPSPEPDRPVLRLIARLAKTMLWMAFFAEEPHEAPQQVRSYPPAGEYPALDHRSSL